MLAGPGPVYEPAVLNGIDQPVTVHLVNLSVAYTARPLKSSGWGLLFLPCWGVNSAGSWVPGCGRLAPWESDIQLCLKIPKRLCLNASYSTMYCTVHLTCTSDLVSTISTSHTTGLHCLPVVAGQVAYTQLCLRLFAGKSWNTEGWCSRWDSTMLLLVCAASLVPMFRGNIRWYVREWRTLYIY